MVGVVIVGTGDHARVVADLVQAVGRSLIGFVELDADREPGMSISSVIGDLERDLDWREEFQDAEFVVAIGAARIRERAFGRCVELGLRAAVLVHPSAVLLGQSAVGEGSQVCAQAVVGVGAVVGRNVIVNTAASIDHDVTVEDHAFIGPGARVAGRVRVGSGAHVGIGATVREGIIIGAGALVAAGAVVIDDVPPLARVAGVPARPMKSQPGETAR